MYKKILSYFIVFSLFISLFSNVAVAQETYSAQPHLEIEVQKELSKSMGEEKAKEFKSEVQYDEDQNKHKINIEHSENDVSSIQSEVIIDGNNNLEINVKYVDDFNNEIDTTYEVLPIVYNENELVAEIIDKKTGEKHLLNTNEMNASVVPIIIAHIIRVGVSAAAGLVGRALVSAAVKKLTFRSAKLLDEHFDKHVIKKKEYGNISKQTYLEKAQNLIGSDSSNVLSKKRADGSRVFYNKSTNDFAILSKDGYIQTLFKPDDKLDYYNRQK